MHNCQHPLTLESVLLNKRGQCNKEPEHCNQRVAPAHSYWRKPTHSGEDPAQPKINLINQFSFKNAPDLEFSNSRPAISCSVFPIRAVSINDNSHMLSRTEYACYPIHSAFSGSWFYLRYCQFVPNTQLVLAYLR